MLMQHSLQSNFRILNIFLHHTSVFFAHSTLFSLRFYFVLFVYFVSSCAREIVSNGDEIQVEKF